MEFEVQAYYGDDTGWEMVTGATDFKDAKKLLKDYRDAETGIPHRIWAEFGDSDADKRALEFFGNMLSDGSSYVNYWATVKWVGDSVQVTDDSDPVYSAVVEPAMLAVAHARLAELEAAGKFHCCGQEEYVQGIQANLMAGVDELDYDACTADACFQLAVLDKIVHG